MAPTASLDISAHPIAAFFLNKAKPGTKLHVDALLWGEDELEKRGDDRRVPGTFRRFANRQELRVVIDWDDGQGSHDIAELIQHGIVLEGYAPGAVDAGMSIARARGGGPGVTAPIGDDPSDPDEDLSSHESSDADEGPAQTTTTRSGIVWNLCAEQISVERRTSGNFEPKLRAAHDTITSLAQLFLYMLPPALTDQACLLTNARIASPDEHVDKLDMLLFYAYIICITTNWTKPVAEMWSQSETGFTGAANIGRHGMSKNRFQFIWSKWRCGPDAEPGPDQDPWARVRPLIDSFNSHMANIFVPGYMLVVDESMCAWRGLGLPHLSFVPRKPEPLGVENKTTADALSKVVIYIEPCEGKERTQRKEFEDRYGHTVATTLRLTKNWARSGRVVAGDSWFASVATAVAMKRELDLYFFGIVKTAHSGFPKDELARVGAAKGSWSTYTATHEGVDLIAVGHRKGQDKVNMLIATCGRTVEGERMSYDYTEGTSTGQRKTFKVSWAAPVIANEWTKAQPAIDANNWVRQADVPMEKRFGTHDCFTRYQMHVLGVVMANTIEAWCNILNQKRTSPRELAEALGMELIQYVKVQHAMPRGPSSSLAGLSTGTLTGSHGGSNLSTRDSPAKHITVTYFSVGKAAGFQRKCVICGKDTSSFCSRCGTECPVHPHLVRGRKEPCLCLTKHASEPDFRLLDERKRSAAPSLPAAVPGSPPRKARRG